MKRSTRSLPLLVLTSLALLVAAMRLPAQTQKRHVALINARIVTVTNGVIERGTLVINEGRIESLGANVTAPAGAEVIDCAGLTVYPGFVDAGTVLGLVEVGSLPETVDNNELGDITPQSDALTAVNPNSVSIPVTRLNGVTSALVSPGGGVLPGISALINLHGYTPAQMDMGFRGLIVNFPSLSRRSRRDDRSQEEINKGARKTYEKLEEVFRRAEVYARIDSAERSGRQPAGSEKASSLEYVPEIAAVVPAVRREMPVLIEVGRAGDIDSAIAWVARHHLRAIFTGVQEGWRVADKIAAAGIPCIVGPVLSMPTRGSDRYDKAYANAGLLRNAGVQVALRTNEASNVRNLPFQAGFAAAYGMGRDEALRAVTIVPATIFGVDREIGSLEVGKRANLFVANGDPFEPSTTVSHLFIDGYKIPLTSRHVELYDEFLNRQPGLKK